MAIPSQGTQSHFPLELSTDKDEEYVGVAWSDGFLQCSQSPLPHCVPGMACLNTVSLGHELENWEQDPAPLL